MGFRVGQLAVVPYLWCFCWAFATLTIYNYGIMPSYHGISAMALATLIVSAVSAVVGLITAASVKKSTGPVVASAVLNLVSSAAIVTYVIWFHSHILNNFERAVQNLHPEFRLDSRTEWRHVRNLMMRFGDNVDARFGVGLLDTVEWHYGHYIVRWGAKIITMFAVHGLLSLVVATCLMTYLAREITAAKKAAPITPQEVDVGFYVPPAATPNSTAPLAQNWPAVNYEPNQVAVPVNHIA